MNLQQMKYVLYTARYNSFSRAAKELFVTQPNISNAVKELEQELKIQIFERKKNGVSLTREGALLVGQIAPVMEQMGFIQEFYAQGQGNENILSIACQHCMAAVKAIAELLCGLHTDRYTVRFLEVKTKEVLRYVHSGMAELGVLLKNPENKVLAGELEQYGLEFTLLQERRPFVYLSSRHPLAERKMITAEDLRPYPYIKYDQGKSSMQFYSEEVVEPYEADKTIAVTDNMTLFMMTQTVDGYTIGSGYRNQCRAGKGRLGEWEVVVIPYDTEETIELGLVTSRGRDLSRLGRQYAAALRKAVKNAEN